MTETAQARADQRVQTICLLILTLFASGLALYWLKPVLVPFVLAIFFTYCLMPLIDVQMEYLHLPRGAAIAGAALLGLVILTLFVFLAAVAVSEIADHLEDYREQFNQVMDELSQKLPLDKVGIHLDPEHGWSITIPEPARKELLSTIVGGVADIVSHGAVVAVFMLFLLVGRKNGPPSGLLAVIERRIKGYILQVVFFSVLTGFLVGAALALLGVPFAVVFGFLAFLLNFIPTIGSFIATLLPLPVVLLSPEMSVAAKVLALAIPGGIQFALGNIVQPKIQGGALQLHPVVVLMSLIFFGMIWGIIGAFLAMPIVAVIKIVFEKIPALRPLAEMLGGNLETFSRLGEEADLNEAPSGPLISE